MRTGISHTFVMLAMILGFASCNLERSPLTDLPDSNFWTGNDVEENAMMALTPLYRGSITNGLEYGVSDFWSYHGLLFMEHLTDNAYDRRGENNDFFKLTNGKLTADNKTLLSYWKSAYSRIGNCNRFLENIARVDDFRSRRRMTAEARFLRAVQYHYLTSYFCNVPLVTTSLTGEEANNVKPTLQTDILTWTEKELREAAADLPRFKDIPSSETGRACKQAALAFLGRTYMLHHKWKEGAEVYKEIINYGDNDIEPSYPALFLPGTGVGNRENIFYVAYLENYFGCGLPQQALSAKDGGWSLSNPTAGLFEAYEFRDGTPFSYDDARYNPHNLGENRDPRLDYTIYYNGASFRGTTYRISPDYDAGKKERLDYSSETSRTGFMWRKYLTEDNIGNLSSYSAVTPIIRYAEVLLSYLECIIESGGNIDQALLDATINKVRSRSDVSMPSVSVSSSEAIMEKLRHERRVELAYEGIRLWDIFRWRMADQALVGDVWGAPYADAVRYSASRKVDPTGYGRWYVCRREFRVLQDYVWPVPLSEQNINPNLRDK